MNCKHFTHIDNDYSFEPLDTQTVEGGRFYSSPVGPLASVTTVTGWEKSKFFAKWRRNNPQESRRVTTRGNALHSIIENYLNNEFDPETDGSDCDPNVIELFNQLQEELDKIDNIYALEVPLWSESMMLAGRVDCVGEYDGKLSVIDFKGCTRAKREKDIENYFMQVAAYSIAWQERTGQSIDNFVILMSCEDGITQVFEDKPIKYVRPLLAAINRYHKEVLV